MSPTAGTAAAGSGADSTLLCLIGVLVAAAFLLVYVLLARRRTRGAKPERASPDPTDEYAAVSTEDLAVRANTALIEADDSLKTSEQELNFAKAQYGTAATSGFSATLEASRVDVTAAFHLRQQLDDEIPDTEEQQRKWYAEIIRRCEIADDRLDAQVDAFDQLRAMEANLETLMPELETKRAGAEAKLPTTTSTYEALTQRYAQRATARVADSGAQIRSRLNFADRTIAQAHDAIRTGNRSLAALAVRAAEEGLGQIDLIHDGVARFAADLDNAMGSVTAMLADLDTDIASGQAAVSASGPGPGSADLAAAVAGAQQVAQTVRAEIAGGRPDPFDELRRLQPVNVRIDAALAMVQEQATRARRARGLLDQSIAAARAQIGAVANFITTRRGAVGSDARTRLAEAERKLDEAVALADDNPVAALAAAQHADRLADQAGGMASDDVDGWDEPVYGGGVAGGMLGGIGGAILGGILIDATLGRGMRGGMGAGMGGGMRSTTFGWGGRMPGSFGGPGTRMRFRI